ncbi:hypothetical protein HU742_011425 [Pseudomonas sp. SWRI102]|uniref:Delta-60 repeat domain-containing protein n=1 Tax=Pseudomonas marvdashtae TaxID=2745500 RepID=A0A923JNW8_9PSED|nr:hypothetical protein [Pseudomonas marvdashtae]MBV4551747.1 hypothetical protein [Pseudomonas marvdashtae]
MASTIRTSSTRQPGELDPGFGVNGVVVPILRTGRVSGIAWDEGERRLTYVAWQGDEFRLYRTLMDGATDTTFGENGAGYVVGNFRGQENSRPTKLLLQRDGKSVVVGDLRTSFFEGLPAVARFERNGDPDSSFGVGGKVVLDVIPSDGLRLGYPSGALQRDGKVLVSLHYTRPDRENVDFRNIPTLQSSKGLLVRLNQDGTLDGSFGENGVITIDHPSWENNQLRCVVVQRDDKIVVGGIVQRTEDGTSYDRMLLVRFTPEGAHDLTFGEAGYVLFGDKGASYALNQVIQDEDGKLVCSGRIFREGAAGGLLMRFDINGGPDSAFHGGLPVIVSPPSQPWGGLWEAAGLQPDGKIVAAGRNVPQGGSTKIFFGRLHPDGTLDKDIGGTGFILGPDGQCWGLVIQDAARRIVVAGAWEGSAAVFGFQA